MPKTGLHVAFIMDGNGRWAEERGKNRLYGHQKGAQALKKIVQEAPNLGIAYVTVYAFSSENSQRPLEEVNGLMMLFKEYLSREIKELHAHGVCVRFIGKKTCPLPSGLCALMAEAEELTKENAKLKIQIALNYSGREEILHASQKIAQKVHEGTMHPQEINEESFQKHLWTYPYPEPDLLIRTSGECRLSNFLLWQLHYTEFFFVPYHWPDLSIANLKEILEKYTQRHRRFGKLAAES